MRAKASEVYVTGCAHKRVGKLRRTNEGASSTPAKSISIRLNTRLRSKMFRTKSGTFVLTSMRSKGIISAVAKPMKQRISQAVISAHNEAAAGTDRSALRLDLKAYRERSGISLEAIVKVTRIGLHFLRAIEAEEFARLPGGVYSTSYIRQYARAVGYNEVELLQHYHCLIQLKPTDEADLPHGRFAEWLGGFVHHFWVKRKGQPAA